MGEKMYLNGLNMDRNAATLLYDEITCPQVWNIYSM